MRFLLLCYCAWALMSCSEKAAYKAYQSVSIDGWDASDSVVFTVDSLSQGGNYRAVVGVRSSVAQAYEFRTLFLEVRQQWQGTPLVCDTVACELSDQRGDMEGDGTLYQQYEFPISHIALQSGQRGRIVVRHIMRREILSGISDIGFLLLP